MGSGVSLHLSFENSSMKNFHIIVLLIASLLHVEDVIAFADSSEISVSSCNAHCPNNDKSCGSCCLELGYKPQYSSCRSRRCLCRNVNPFESDDSFAGAEIMTNNDNKAHDIIENTYSHYQPPQTHYAPPKTSFGSQLFATMQPPAHAQPQYSPVLRQQPLTHYAPPKPSFAEHAQYKTPNKYSFKPQQNAPIAAKPYSQHLQAQVLPSTTKKPTTPRQNTAGTKATPSPKNKQAQGSVSGCEDLCPRHEFKCSLCCQGKGFKVYLSGCHGRTCICE